jgi:hypothetical protein
VEGFGFLSFILAFGDAEGTRIRATKDDAQFYSIDDCRIFRSFHEPFASALHSVEAQQDRSNTSFGGIKRQSTYSVVVIAPLTEINMRL